MQDPIKVDWFDIQLQLKTKNYKQSKRSFSKKMSGKKQFATFVFAESFLSFDVLWEGVKNLQPRPDDEILFQHKSHIKEIWS